MAKCITAHTNLDPTYPGYVNFTRQDDGSVTVIVRGDPTTVEGSYICAYAHERGQHGRCTPGDQRCNNYCNLAPAKGPMQDHPLKCSHVREGATASVKLSAEAFAALIAQTAAEV